jgi:uncharacterized membrane protein
MPKPGPKSQPGAKTTVEVAASFSGPIPPPSLLNGYETACPGAADRIIRMAEEQSLHRRKMEESLIDLAKENMRLDYAEGRLGQIFGFALALGLVGFGAVVITKGYPWPGSLMSGVGLVPLIRLFLRREKQPLDLAKQLARGGNEPQKKH